MFVLLIVAAFAGISRSLRLPGLPRRELFATWALGTALFMHCVNFIAVSYFEQIVTLWFVTLGAIGSLTLVPGAAPAAQIAQRQPVPATS